MRRMFFQNIADVLRDIGLYGIYTLFAPPVQPNKEKIIEHAGSAGIPANKIEEIKTMISPVTAE